MNNNEQPKYVLKTTEDIPVYKDKKLPQKKKAILVILAILIIGSFLLGDNLFGELSFMPKILLIGLVFGTLFSGKKENAQFPLELHFYDDRIEIHRLEVHYSNGTIKRELHVFKYDDTPVCVYDKRNRYVTIKGMAHGEWYLYSKDGSLSNKPERVSDTQGICYFYASETSNVDIVKEIEEHSPIKVTIENA